MNRLLTLACLMMLAFTDADACPDFDGNGTVDIQDFLLFTPNFGTTEARYDLNADGQVNISDFLVFVEHFGKECPKKAPEPEIGTGFDLHEDNDHPTGITYANNRFYVPDRDDKKVYAYTSSGQRQKCRL